MGARRPVTSSARVSWHAAVALSSLMFSLTQMFLPKYKIWDCNKRESYSVRHFHRKQLSGRWTDVRVAVVLDASCSYTAVHMFHMCMEKSRSKLKFSSEYPHGLGGKLADIGRKFSIFSPPPNVYLTLDTAGVSHF